MTGLKNWYFVLMESQVNVRGPCKCVRFPIGKKKKKSPFPPGTEPNCSKPLVYLSTEADQIISCSKPIFFYLYAFTNFRGKVISNGVERNLFWKKVHSFEVRVEVLKGFCQNTGNKPLSKLPQSCNDFFQNKNPRKKERKKEKILKSSSP